MKAKREVEGTITELFDDYGPNEGRHLLGSVSRAFATNPRMPEFRIPAADNGEEVFFNHREVFCRFASMCIAAQREFLSRVRLGMDKEKTNSIVVEVKWGASTKRLHIVELGDGAFLKISV